MQPWDIPALAINCEVSVSTMLELISPENPAEAIRRILAVIVEHAGGDFVGIQEATPERGFALTCCLITRDIARR
jgi:hypothetical protein